jgi:flagellar biosynthesis protein FliR
MPVNLTFSPELLFSFLLVLARISGAVVFVPLPGMRSVPEPARVALALGMTLALVSRWPAVDSANLSGPRMLGWAIGEASFGIAIGIAVAVAVEAFTLAAQVLGLQAGYAYASTIDPNSEADSGVLLVFAQLTAGMMFFALGLDRQVLRLFAASLERIPPGGWVLGPKAGEAVIRLCSGLFSTALRLAFPVVALLVMVDVALALLGRINAQLQLLSLAFPAKMLIALLVLAWIAALFPRILWQFSGQTLGAAGRALGL